MSVKGFIEQLSGELQAVFTKISEEEVEGFVELVSRANKIFVTGAGRIGTSSRAFAMRLMHLGKPTYWLVDDTTPSNGEGDLHIANSGSGNTPSTYQYARKAKDCGTYVATITANRER